MSKETENFIIDILALANIEINGSHPWDLQVHNEKLYKRILSGGTLAFGESYMDGWWDVPKLDQFFTKVLFARLDKKIRNWKTLGLIIKSKITNQQNFIRAWKAGRVHYDIGNKLYTRMLDKRMMYSCGYWKNADTLDQAQIDKLELCCQKLQLEKGMKVLDIGCGWGGFAKYAAEHYGVEVIGINNSKNQTKLAQESCKDLPVTIKFMDYRDLEGQYDRIISIGMFEHVGYKNYKLYMKIVSKLLKPKGLFLLHTIGGNKSVIATEPWIDKYIFPNSMLPSAKQIANAYQGIFIMEDWHNFGPDYDQTLMAWYDHFIEHWAEIKDDYDDRFKRMWTYYLLSCAGSFRARKNQLWQIVLSKGDITKYQGIR
ncbi:MAG: cyclopropane-fatty-acyl-phospholipid synthase [Parcubacteria group bacterium CG1_02_37_51]|uniref:Cyclopropane-fatty-acyl-phospholipid synthase n=2 Tax=Candidatus Komeiliibacteriota TaxID=1817908 RepID=A0A2M8DQQ8_9BACT|nr:MAG: cyclopropane-fatty-acyl-phospholipid synthase [Parcubacteria group bacterium CG1_02_37_51]PIY93793.1 MAG: cyclopropane-fatty-acyl-phospholipid synthase [Candidatus Komeilibacteria bacterium CG_4_10_14_0_8_um_filter_37_78]PJC01593.1 MAG: cyclopropane-fatty-acyl-phospholipid synthase [Candidatus Komeilibacteria bacterium CG_4_9_14_0_8_um_filter_36_9]